MRFMPARMRARKPSRGVLCAHPHYEIIDKGGVEVMCALLKLAEVRVAAYRRAWLDLPTFFEMTIVSLAEVETRAADAGGGMG